MKLLFPKLEWQKGDWRCGYNVCLSPNVGLWYELEISDEAAALLSEQSKKGRKS